MAGTLAAAACAVLLVVNLLATVLAGWRWSRRRVPAPPAVQPPVSLVRPLRGVETFSAETLAATFALEWPAYEVLFCVQDARDPIVPLVREAMARHPGVDARLLIGDDPISGNPKLNNCVKGWRAARHEWIAIADSNVLMPPNYLAALTREFRDDTGLVVSVPLGTRPATFFATVECAMLNTFQARWQYAVAAFGYGFAQGKNMLWRRDVLDRVGGIAALAREPAEDAAATRILREAGLRIRLVDYPFEQPLGPRTAREVWARHTRWARLRRATFPVHFLPEILTGGFLPLLLAAWAASLANERVMLWTGLVAAVFYGSELLLTQIARMPLGWSTLPAMLVRDLLLPVLYIDAWLFDDFVWHGQQMSVSEKVAR